jgi:hypothetical protein
LDDHKFQKEVALTQILLSAIIAFGTAIFSVGLAYLPTPFAGLTPWYEGIGIGIILSACLIGYRKLKKL